LRDWYEQAGRERQRHENQVGHRGREGDSPLSPRETAVLAASSDGSSVVEVASRLHLSEGTVRNHLSAAIQKLSARNRADAARIMLKGWL
jgi:two-component system response regulator DesR